MDDLRESWLEFWTCDLCGESRYQDAVMAYDRIKPTKLCLEAWKKALALAKEAQKAGKLRMDPLFLIRARMLSFAHPTDAGLDFWVEHERGLAERENEGKRKEAIRTYSKPVHAPLHQAELRELAKSVLGRLRPPGAPTKPPEPPPPVPEPPKAENSKEVPW